MISHRYKCFYVAVPKCASSTILDWFLMHGGGWHSCRPWWYGGLLIERIPGQAKAMNLYPDYATFTFVRNPYDRFVSTWLHACRQVRQVRQAQAKPHGMRIRPDDYGTLREFAELCGEFLADFGPLWGRDARDFFQANAEREYGPRRIKLKYLRYMIVHARLQTDFLPDCHPERLLGVERVNGDPLSFIGTVENLEADLGRLAELLGFPDPRLPDFGLPVSNSSGFGSRTGNGERYAAYYDGATRRLVEDIYAADFAFTGYDFHDGRTMIAVPASEFSAAVRRPARRRSMGMLSARVWHRLWSVEIRVEEWLLRSATARGLLHLLGKLRGLPRWARQSQ